MTTTETLFTPTRLGAIDVKNRIAMAPMTRSRSPDAYPTAENVAYYQRRAAAEVGLLISEGTLTRRKGGTVGGFGNMAPTGDGSDLVLGALQR